MKEKDLDKDTIVAYHAYLQTRIHNELNGVGLGPGWLPCRMGLVCIALSVASLVTGVLVITLRHRHVYLVDWWHAFVGPFFIILFLILMTLACYLIITAKRRSNQYRRELFFRPIGDYGVAVVHKSTLIHEQEHKSDLKTGTTPHRTVMPRSEAFSSHGRERKQGHENRGYNHNGHEDRHQRDGRDRRHHDDDRRRHDDRHRDRDRDDRRRHDDRERKRHPDDRRDDHRRPPRDERDRGEKRRPPPENREKGDYEKRRPPPDDRERGDYEKRRPPPDDRERGDYEKRRPPPDDRMRGDEKVRPPPDNSEQRTSSQGGRRAARGAPRLHVTDTSKDSKIVLDADFGKPADDESEL
ncbi:pre-mRNA-splicing factor 38B-like [Haliotis rufescens]|uniref:pre-mRNA-splicing factor 38B-like n=1 Tax=Haliotis rufescens TaxID=6454 RepID=UPI001EB06132|nr:pre-mRNA-splicing factor 38B-like [Haliotis rufescens]